MQHLRYLVLLFLFAMGQLQGKIIETKQFKEIFEYISRDTLVIFDIDDTLLLPVQTLGTDVWFNARLAHHQRVEQDRFLALDRALAEWEAVRHLTQVKIVEPGTDGIVDDLQKDKVVVMGLTTQGLALATRTVMQLKSLGIDLSKTAPSSEDHYFMNGRHGVLFRHGILFTSGTAKGEALMKFLDAAGYYPKEIIFINDKQSHLHDVETSVEAKNIEFTGLRYSYGDERVANYSQDIADIQWTQSTLDHLLSDEEAAILLK